MDWKKDAPLREGMVKNPVVYHEYLDFSDDFYPGSMIRQLAAHGLAAPGACALADWSELEPRLLLNRKAGTSPGPRSRSK